MLQKERMGLGRVPVFLRTGIQAHRAWWKGALRRAT